VARTSIPQSSGTLFENMLMDSTWNISCYEKCGSRSKIMIWPTLEPPGFNRDPNEYLGRSGFICTSLNPSESEPGTLLEIMPGNVDNRWTRALTYMFCLSPRLALSFVSHQSLSPGLETPSNLVRSLKGIPAKSKISLSGPNHSIHCLLDLSILITFAWGLEPM
jgi:hypothetical protein